MTGPADPSDPLEEADPFERALAAAFQPPTEVRVWPTAGVRLRGRVARRRAERAAVGVACCLVLVAVITLGVGTMLHDQRGSGGSGSMVRAAQASRQAGGEGDVLGMGAKTAPQAEPAATGQPNALRSGVRYEQTILTNPVRVVQVTPATYQSCPRPGSSRCPELSGPDALVVKWVVEVNLTPVADSSAVGVSLTLGDADRASYATYSTEHLGTQVAFVVSGRTWTATTISRPVTSGVLQIVAGRSESDAVALVHSLGPRPPAGPGAKTGPPRW